MAIFCRLRSRPGERELVQQNPEVFVLVFMGIIT